MWQVKHLVKSRRMCVLLFMYPVHFHKSIKRKPLMICRTGSFSPKRLFPGIIFSNLFVFSMLLLSKNVHVMMNGLYMGRMHIWKQ